MGVPQCLVDFLAAWEALGESCECHRWGTVTGDSRFPYVWDANRALVAGFVTPSLDEVVAALEPMRRRGGARYLQFEVVDLNEHARLVAELREAHGEPACFAVMVAGDDDIERPTPDDLAVTEARAPDGAMWRAAKAASHADEEPLPDAVMRQLCDRDALIQFPAGRRLFVGSRAGEEAGFATYHSLAGVGLVDDVVTHPHHRAHGVASAIVRRIVDVSREAGDMALFLFCAQDGAACRLYRRLGFEQVAVSGQFHHDMESRGR